MVRDGKDCDSWFLGIMGWSYLYAHTLRSGQNWILVVALVLEKGKPWKQPSIASPKCLVITFISVVSVSWNPVCFSSRNEHSCWQTLLVFWGKKVTSQWNISFLCFTGTLSAIHASLIILLTLLFWRHSTLLPNFEPAYPIGYLFLKASKRGTLNHIITSIW